jgi:predicted O-linked N-acetylglucosamine transferase (SPINDLY family)
VFCSFNNVCKIAPQVFDIWMRLLHAVPGSVLWFITENEHARLNLSREARARGVDPARLVFGRMLPYAQHLARIHLADLFLDTFPFNAGTTASDALWAGVPVLTCAGEAFASRMAGSLLRSLGIPELITTSLQEYESVAMALSTSSSTLEAIRARLEANRSTHALFDTERFRRNVEAAYCAMWARFRSGEEPAGFSVDCVPS